MQTAFDKLRGSSSAKVGVIGLLVLVLLIPVGMILGVIDDRSRVSEESRQEIMRAWGWQQVIAGPILVLPYEIVRISQYGERIVDEGMVFLLPRELSIDAELIPEIRYRGIHEVPVYTAHTNMKGTFGPPDISGLGIDNATVDWDRAYIALSITDARPIKNTPELDINGTRSQFRSGGTQIAGLAPQITASLGDYFGDSARDEALQFSIDLDVSGTDSLQYMPFGDETKVSIRSSWPSPSFIGNYLPETREIGDSGFTANWRVSSLGRSYPSRWTSAEVALANGNQSAFGVDFFIPIGLYQLTTRATKYAILFIGLTFVSFFLFEVMAGLRLHPLQYLLVGFANTLFYLLLLSLAEHIGFAAAYLTSTLASAGLITGYSLSVLGSRARALLVMAILGILYSFLYLILSAETYAMLAGSIGLWAALGLVMYLTRRINWFNEVTED